MRQRCRQCSNSNTNAPGIRPSIRMLVGWFRMAGAADHRTIDPVVVGSSIVMALQTIVSRNVDPLQMGIVTVGAFCAGKANNVIPETAVLEISVRSHSPEVRILLERRLRAVVAGQVESYGAQASIELTAGYPVLVNSDSETEFARDIAYQIVGKDRVVDQGPLMLGSEDFAYMLQEVPGCYFFVGNGAGDAMGACAVHNPKYDFNDTLIGVGASYWVAFTNQFLVP